MEGLYNKGLIGDVCVCNGFFHHIFFFFFFFYQFMCASGYRTPCSTSSMDIYIVACTVVESGIFGQVSEDMGRRACFGQFDSVDSIHDVGLESSAFSGHSWHGTGTEFDPTWTGDRLSMSGR